MFDKNINNQKEYSQCMKIYKIESSLEDKVVGNLHIKIWRFTCLWDEPPNDFPRRPLVWR